VPACPGVSAKLTPAPDKTAIAVAAIACWSVKCVGGGVSSSGVNQELLQQQVDVQRLGQHPSHAGQLLVGREAVALVEQVLQPRANQSVQIPPARKWLPDPLAVSRQCSCRCSRRIASTSSR